MLKEMKMKNKYVLIKDKDSPRSPSGLWLPQSTYERRAEVLEVGEDEDIHVGDTVLKTIGQGTEIRVNGEWVEAIHKNNILAVFKNKLGGEENN